MRFRVDQHFTASPEAVLDLYTNPDFYPQLSGLPKVATPDVLERRVEGPRVLMRVRYRFTAPLPAAARAVIDPDRLTWVDETWFDLTARSSTTRLLPDHYPDKMTASAAARFVGDAAGPTRRQVEGDLRVSVLLVGGQVERAIVSGLSEHLADEEKIAQRCLDTGI